MDDDEPGIVARELVLRFFIGVKGRINGGVTVAVNRNLAPIAVQVDDTLPKPLQVVGRISHISGFALRRLIVRLAQKACICLNGAVRRQLCGTHDELAVLVQRCAGRNIRKYAIILFKADVLPERVEDKAQFEGAPFQGFAHEWKPVWISHPPLLCRSASLGKVHIGARRQGIEKLILIQRRH